MRHPILWSWRAFVWAIISEDLLRCTSGTLAPPASSTRPVIRIANLASEGYGSTPIRFMMQQLNNRQRTLLPDYDIVVDDYTVRNGGGPVELLRMLGDDTPTYHAIAGPFWRQDSLDIVDLVATARVLNVHGGDSPSFSDRTKHPYTFRNQRSLQGTQIVMFYLAASNDWRSVVSIWAEQDLWDASNTVAESMNVSNYPTLSEVGAASWAVEAWQTGIVDLIRSSRIRVLIVHVTINTGWQLICRVHRAELSGIQYFVESSWAPAWFLSSDYPGAWGDCTPQEMYVAAGGHLVIRHTPFAPGASFLGVSIPAVGGDQSQIPLTCMPNMTANDFLSSSEHLGMAAVDGVVTDENSAKLYVGYAGVMTDSVCAELLALHDVLYVKGLSLCSIERREATAFTELVHSLSQVDLRSPTGRFRFYNGTGDPEYIFHILSQDAVDGRIPGSYDIAGVISFPDGPDQTPSMDTLGDAFPLIWRDGSKGVGPRPHLGLFPDCGLVNGVLHWDRCKPCSPGTFYDGLLQACRTCPLGQFQNESGMDSCETAPPGWFITDVDNPSSISRCPKGHECPQAGTITPQPCAMGRFAAAFGQAACELCPEGQFQNSTAQESCRSCSEELIGSVTAAIASTSSSECICPQGTFRHLGASHCSLCLKAMQCPEGSDMRNVPQHNSLTRQYEHSTPRPFPQVDRGYMTMSSDPLTVYRCIADGQCPGGLPGTCASGRDPTTAACGDCMSNAYEAGDECVKCDGRTGALPLIMASFTGLFLVVMATVVINKDVHKAPASSMMIVAVTGLLLTSLQTMGVFSSMDLPWEEPVKTLLSLSEVLSFDLRLLRASCLMGVNPLRSFAMRQLTAILVIPFVLLTLILKKYSPRWGKPRTRIRVEFCNSIGTLYSVFFISIVMSAMDPFMCYSHPGDSGESVTSAPSILCFQGGEHSSMVILGLIAMVIIPVPFACLCLYAIHMYPQKIILHRNNDFLHATRFLFFRYVPHRYFFQIVILLRSLLLCLVPAILRGKFAVQVLLISVVLSSYVSLTYIFCPWRVRQCNLLDALLGQLLCLLLLCGGLFLEDAPQKGTISILSSVVISIILLSTLIALSYAAWNRLAPSCFQFFICHHKAHAAAQSRYLKMQLQKKQRTVTVFIDSDDLRELDTLFDIVKCRVKHLVVFLTAETLKRPWCVGEIVTAMRAALLVTRLETPSFVAPTHEQRNCPESFLDTTGCNLSEYGIHWVDVTDGFSAFLGSVPSVLELRTDVPGTLRFEHAATCLLKQRVADHSVRQLSDIRTGSVVVVTRPGSDEASASGGILLERMAPHLFRVCERGVTLLCDHVLDMTLAFEAVHRASAVVVVLSPGCLQSQAYVSIICELMCAQHVVHESTSAPPAVVSVNTPGFEFPSAVAIDEICRSFPGLDRAYTSMASRHMTSFFRRISVLLPTHAAQHVLDTHSDEVSCRVQAGIKSRSAKGVLSRDSTETRVMLLNTSTDLPPSDHASPTGSACMSANVTASGNADKLEYVSAREDAREIVTTSQKGYKWMVEDIPF